MPATGCRRRRNKSRSPMQRSLAPVDERVTHLRGVIRLADLPRLWDASSAPTAGDLVTGYRSARVRICLARVLAVVFAACGGLTVTGSAVAASTGAWTPVTGASSVPWAPLAAGSVGLAYAFAGVSNTAGSATAHGADAATALSSAPTVDSAAASTRRGRIGVRSASLPAAGSRAPPLT